MQSNPAVLLELWGKPYVITEKIDGTSATFLIDPEDDTFHACGRTQSQIDSKGNLYWNIARKYKIEEALREWPHLAIQGEIYGPGIQANNLGVPMTEFAAFNVYSIIRGAYLSHVDAVDVLHKLDIPTVREIEKGSHFDYTQEQLLAKAEGKYAGTKNEREGIVIRPLYEEKSVEMGGDRLSFKVISNRFLLKGGE